jgi:glycerol-3-phosphate dehydrogenase
MSRVVVVGNTGWGRTIAALLRRNVSDVCLLPRTEDEAVALRGHGGEYCVSHEPRTAFPDSEYVVWAARLRRCGRISRLCVMSAF